MKIIIEQIGDEQVPHNVPIHSANPKLHQVTEPTGLAVTQGCPKSRSEWTIIEESGNQNQGVNE